MLLEHETTSFDLIPAFCHFGRRPIVCPVNNADSITGELLRGILLLTPTDALIESCLRYAAFGAQLHWLS